MYNANNAAVSWLRGSDKPSDLARRAVSEEVEEQHIVHLQALALRHCEDGGPAQLWVRLQQVVPALRRAHDDRLRNNYIVSFGKYQNSA